MSLATVTLTGTLPGAAGAVATFTPSAWRTDSTDKVLLPPVPDPVTLDANGSFSVPLLPTDSAGTGPAGWSWQVTFTGIPGLLPYTFSFLLPAAGAPVVNGVAVRDITDPALAPVIPSAGAAGATAAALAAEAARAEGAESSLSTAAAAEVSRASAAEGALSAALSGAASSSALTAETARAQAAEALMVPLAGAFTLANNAYQVINEWTVTGQTDSPLPSFGTVAGSQTYSWGTGGETTQGPAFWFGINPRHLSGWAAGSPHAALGISAFADAGDTWDPATGGHGLEFNIAWVSPSGAKGVAPVEIVGADDETRTVTLALRCGDGQFTSHDGNPYVSGITMTDAAGTSYLSAGPFNNSAYTPAGGSAVAANTAPGVQLGAPLALTRLPYLYGTSAGGMTALFTASGAAGAGAVSWTVQSNSDTLTALFSAGTSNTFSVLAYSGPAAFTVQSAAGGLASSAVLAQGASQTAQFKATSSSGTAQFILNGNSTVSAQMVWQKNGANTWVMQDIGGSGLYLTNNSGNAQMLMLSGANSAGSYDNAATYLLSQVQVYGSLAVSNGGAALATTATRGFIYLPTTAGAPTGVPAAIAGSIAGLVDTVNSKVWFYVGGAWKGAALS